MDFDWKISLFNLIKFVGSWMHDWVHIYPGQLSGPFEIRGKEKIHTMITYKIHVYFYLTKSEETGITRWVLISGYQEIDIFIFVIGTKENCYKYLWHWSWLLRVNYYYHIVKKDFFFLTSYEEQWQKWKWKISNKSQWRVKKEQWILTWLHWQHYHSCSGHKWHEYLKEAGKKRTTTTNIYMKRYMFFLTLCIYI